MMAHGALLTALLSACAASGEDVGAGGLHEMRSILEAHAGGPHSNPTKRYLQEYLGGLTHAAHDGTIDSEGEVPPPPTVADGYDDGAEAELRELASDASNASNASNVTTSVLDFTCRCRDGTAATGTSCTADNAEVCDECNDGFALNADNVCEVSKTGALTSGRTCVYRFIGGGYCHPLGMNTEKPVRIGTWVDGNRQDAEKACCQEEMCEGFHLDKDKGDFVLLRKLATEEDSWERRECWKKKITKDGEDLEEPDSAPLQALPLAAAAAAMLLHAAGA